MKAVTVQAKQNSIRVRSIMALYEEIKAQIQEVTHSQYSIYLLDAIFSKPIFRVSDLVKNLKQECGIYEKTTPGLLRQLKEAGILQELQAGSGSRSAVLYFPRLINTAEGNEMS